MVLEIRRLDAAGVPDSRPVSKSPECRRHAQFHAEVEDGLSFIKPHFNEDMRAGNTNM